MLFVAGKGASRETIQGSRIDRPLSGKARSSSQGMWWAVRKHASSKGIRWTLVSILLLHFIIIFDANISYIFSRNSFHVLRYAPPFSIKEFELSSYPYFLPWSGVAYLYKYNWKLFVAYRGRGKKCDIQYRTYCAVMFLLVCLVISIIALQNTVELCRGRSQVHKRVTICSFHAIPWKNFLCRQSFFCLSKVVAFFRKAPNETVYLECLP